MGKFPEGKPDKLGIQVRCINSDPISIVCIRVTSFSERFVIVSRCFSTPADDDKSSSLCGALLDELHERLHLFGGGRIGAVEPLPRAIGA